MAIGLGVESASRARFSMLTRGYDPVRPRRDADSESTRAGYASAPRC
jgi:hypothetical protein